MEKKKLKREETMKEKEQIEKVIRLNFEGLSFTRITELLKLEFEYEIKCKEFYEKEQMFKKMYSKGTIAFQRSEGCFGYKYTTYIGKDEAMEMLAKTIETIKNENKELEKTNKELQKSSDKMFDKIKSIEKILI